MRGEGLLSRGYRTISDGLLKDAAAPTAAIRVTAIEPQGSTQKGGSFKMTETAVRTLVVAAVGAKNGPIRWRTDDLGHKTPT